ncbi:MAG: FAD-binding oxidoreductase [Nitriliruptorales bacterium]|nr:FAD-binding oxidoreductase [Nitriliruptorales bacterium]
MTTVTTRSGGDVLLTASDLDLDGQLVGPDDESYDRVRALWNGMIDREPGLVARCESVDDVRRSVRFAADLDLRLAVRGGGHNVAGTASVDGGLVIDLSAMNGVTVDPGAAVAAVAGGARWAEVDAATQEHGLAAPGGVVSETGVGGLTLGGGIGWLRRKHGLACDSLIGAQLVTADGGVLEIDENDHPDLLWALRGGGGGLGVVTRFDFELHPVGPEVFVAFVLYHGERAAEVLHAYRDYTTELDDEVSSFVILGTVPDEEDFPEDAWGEPYAMLMACAATTDLREGERLVQPLRDLGDPIIDMSGPMPYVDLQQVLDADYPDGLRYYWKSLHLPAMTDDVVELATEWADNRSSDLSTLDIWHLGGAMARVPADATAFGDRSAPYLLGVEANWEAPAQDEANLAWTRGCIEAFRQHSTGEEYLNFPGFFEGGDETRRAAHGAENYERLERIRRQVDPDGVFGSRPGPVG